MKLKSGNYVTIACNHESHVPSVCSIQGNKLVFTFTYSKKMAFTWVIILNSLGTEAQFWLILNAITKSIFHRQSQYINLACYIIMAPPKCIRWRIHHKYQAHSTNFMARSLISFMSIICSRLYVWWSCNYMALTPKCRSFFGITTCFITSKLLGKRLICVHKTLSNIGSLPPT